MSRLRLALLFAALALPARALGQVNTEKLRSWEEAGVGGSADFSMSYKSGNVDVVLASAAARAQWAHLEVPTSSTSSAARPRLVDLVYLIGNVDLGIDSGERFRNAGFSHLRWTRMIAPAFGTEVFAQAQYNEFIKLQQRYLGGAGVRVEPFRSDAFEAAVGLGYMLEFEQNDVPEDGPDERNVLAHRATSYVSVKVYLTDPRVALVNTVYFQPRITDSSDWRLLDEAELEIAITGSLSLVAGLFLRYDSEPVAGVESLDLSVDNRLRVTF